MVGAFEFVKGDKVVRIKSVVTMNLTVNILSDILKELALRHLIIQTVQISVNTWGTVIMNMSLKSEDTGSHAHHIIILALVEVSGITALLELLRFQEVAWVILIRYSQRHDMKALKSLHRRALAPHGHHLQDTLLRSVVGVLRTTLALGYPYIVMLC